jgi:hypothetical protein
MRSGLPCTVAVRFKLRLTQLRRFKIDRNTMVVRCNKVTIVSNLNGKTVTKYELEFDISIYFRLFRLYNFFGTWLYSHLHADILLSSWQHLVNNLRLKFQHLLSFALYFIAIISITYVLKHSLTIETSKNSTMNNRHFLILSNECVFRRVRKISKSNFVMSVRM